MNCGNSQLEVGPALNPVIYSAQTAPKDYPRIPKVITGFTSTSWRVNGKHIWFVCVLHRFTLEGIDLVAKCLACHRWSFRGALETAPGRRDRKPNWSIRHLCTVLDGIWSGHWNSADLGMPYKRLFNGLVLPHRTHPPSSLGHLGPPDRGRLRTHLRSHPDCPLQIGSSLHRCPPVSPLERHAKYVQLGLEGFPSKNKKHMNTSQLAPAILCI